MTNKFGDQTFSLPERTSGSSNQDSGAFQPVQRVDSWDDSSPVIDKFVEAYSKQREHWKLCAEQAKNLIEEQLEDARDENNEEIFAKVTSRAKENRSLLEKLKLRNWQRKEEEDKKPYQTPEEISEDLVDLAGVRVVLYTPNQAQRKKVKEILHKIWGTNIDEKPHGDSRPMKKKNGGRNNYVQRHLGYQADHYRTPMLKEHNTWNAYKYSPGDRVEIQVVSALGHAWAEAGHDVLYKTHAYGRPSIMEQRILDALNGLIVSGDLLLEQFRESVTKRTVEPWEYVSQFHDFLRQSDILERHDDDNNIVTQWDHFSITGTDILFRFLKKINKNHGLAVRNELKDLQNPLAPEPKLQEKLRKFRPTIAISHQLLTTFCIIDHLLPQRQLTENIDLARQCSIMLDALILLQTFAGDPKVARDYLTNAQVEITVTETKGLNVVLEDPQRHRCLAGEDVPFLKVRLQSAWAWFEKQASNPKSLCGLFFRLAEMDVPARELDNSGRLKELVIGALPVRQGKVEQL
jgi:ppGpp synthetase/RelA/SpoT-type nucleotidyltranferase